MGVDVNDLKILINASFQYLMKTCYQWAKDHPLVTGVLLFFYLLYIFFPNLFDILFYTFPLIICIAIILGGKHISSKQNQEQIKNNKKYDVLRSMSIDHRRRRHLTPHMRSMTLGRTEGLLSHDEIKDHTNTKLFNDQISSSASCTTLENPMLEQTSRHTSTGISSHSDTESPDEEENEDEARQARDKVVEWTEDDQRNLMDLGSSEIERNKRLESLIAKRRARKQLSMQPRRAHYPYENLMDQVGTIMVSRCIDHDAEHQPGSAPCVLRLSRNPFDLPYDPHEEKPVLTGGSFDDEFFSNEQKELLEECLNKHDGSNCDVMDESKFLPSFFTKPRSVEKPGFTRFRRGSEESMKDNFEELSKEDARNDREQNQQDLSEKVQPRSSLSLPNEEHHELENPFAKDFDTSKSDSTSASKIINKDELQTKDDNNIEENIFHMNPEEIVTPVEVQSAVQDHVSMINDRDDDQDSTTSSSSSSSSSSSTEMTINAIKNEAFRNSVKKVLTCLVIQRHKANTTHGITHDNAATSNGLLYDSVPNVTTPTKMEERSFYTSKPNHTSTFSIASDMQVEVSDTGSPPLATLDPGSPTDRESLVYDGDVDKDANSGDEDLWGASPHPIRQGDFATKFKLPDITEEGHDVKGSRLREDHSTAEERTSSLQGKEIDQDQRSIDAEIVGSISSGSSSSDGLMSQMQAKSEHLAEFLANLPPTQSGSNALEGPEPSLVRESSAEEQTFLGLDEAKDESKGIDEMAESSQQGSGEQSIVTGEVGAESEIGSISRESIEGELDNHQARIIEDEPRLLEENDHESERNINESYFSEPLGHEKEVIISDSLSTTCQEEILEQSRFDEGGTEKLDEDTKIIHDGEVKENSVDDPVIHDESTFVEKPADDQENDGRISDQNVSQFDKQSMKSGLKLSATEDTPQTATIEEDNMHPLSSIDEAVSSRPIINDSQDNLDHHAMKLQPDEPRSLEENSHESERHVNESYFSEPVGHEKEAIISDSLSTTCQEEILEQSRFDEGGTEKLDEDMPILNDGEVKEDSIDDPVIHDESTFVEKPADDQENDGRISDQNVSQFDEQSMKSELKLSATEDTPQTATIEEDNMHPSSSIDEAVSSRSIINDSQDDLEHHAMKLQHDEPRSLEENDHESERNVNESYFSEPVGHEKEAIISDSLSTTCQEEILEQSRFDEGGTEKLDEHTMISNDGEVKEDSIDDPVIHVESTFVEKPAADDHENDGRISDENALKVDDQSTKREVKLSEAENTPQTATIEEDNMHPLSSTDEAVSSRPIISDSQDKLEHNVP